MMKRLFRSILALLLLLSSCAKHDGVFKRLSLPFFTSYQDNEAKVSKKEHFAPNITIWVHGTCLWPFRVWRRYWNNTPALIKVTSMHKNYYLRKIADTLDNVSEDYPLDDFYFFRWSGKLSVSERLETSIHLHDSIVKLLEKYKEKYETVPNVTIITHSHGGNVALNLSLIKDKEQDIKIKNLILLACPVQAHTKDFVNDDIFENVYSFYSSLDLIQILDPQGLQYPACNGKKVKGSSLFSGRNFPHHTKLCNVKLKLNGKGVWHGQFLSKEFVAILPQIIKNIDSWKESERSRNYFISIFLKKQKPIKQLKK